MNKFKLKIHQWVDGVLQTIEHEFEYIEDAFEHVAQLGYSVFKIFDSAGNLCHSSNSNSAGSYATYA